MTGFSEATIDHLRAVLDWPDLGATKYEVLEKLGEGGMATVYLARDRDLDREVAIKVERGLEADPDTAARMLAEARILAKLEHPGIVPIHDSGVLPDGRLYLAMKRVRGRRLDEHASRVGSLSEKLLLFVKVCEAVQFAHEHGFLHRDLKPANIMVGAFGEALVMDWGVAKRLDERSEAPAGGAAVKPGQTAHGTVLGTPGFMSPEQERGELDRIDERTDVYALGAILRLLLAGAACPPPLGAICERATAPERNDRYAGAAALADEVMRYLSGLRVEAHREGIWGALGRLASKYRLALSLILAYLAMRMLLAVFAGA